MNLKWEYYEDTNNYDKFAQAVRGMEAWVLYDGNRNPKVGIYRRNDRWWIYWHTWLPGYMFNNVEEAKAVAAAFVRFGFPEGEES